MLKLSWTAALASLVVPMLMWPVAAYSQVISCPPDRTGGTFDDVIVRRSCTLSGTTVRGSVMVSNRASLTLTGGTEVRGNVLVNSGGAITVGAATVLGDVSLLDSGNLSLGAGASLGSVRVEKSGSISMNGGSVASIESKESNGITLTDATVVGGVTMEKSTGALSVDGGSVASIASRESGGIGVANAKVFPGGVTLQKSTGSLVLCGSEIGLNTDLDPETDDLGQGSGGITVFETTGDVLLVESGSCASSRMRGSVAVAKGTGHVRLVGATLDSGDLSVFDQQGDVEVDGASLSDILIEKTTGGHVSLRDVTTDSDTTIAGNQGDVVIDSSTLGSDVGIASNGSVAIRGNSFALEDVLVSKNRGPVVIERNCDLTLSILENAHVVIANNNPTDASAAGATCTSGFGLTDVDVSKNGNVSIVGNTGELLKCSDNGSISGADNDFTFTDGQCAGF